MHQATLRLFLTAFLCAGVTGACKKDSDKAPAAAAEAPADTPAAAAPAAAAPAQNYRCDKAGDWCTEYSGDALILGDEALKGACEAMSGAFATGTCSRDKSLGSCGQGKGQLKIYYPSSGDMGNTPDSVKSDCDLFDGKFTAATP